MAGAVDARAGGDVDPGGFGREGRSRRSGERRPVVSSHAATPMLMAPEGMMPSSRSSSSSPAARRASSSASVGVQ